MLKVENLTRIYGDKKVVDGLSFEVGDGEFVALLGPSGCGKSTSLNMIAGLEQTDAGRIELDGNDITALDPGQRQLAMVFQFYALFPHLSVKENILFGLKARKVNRSDQQRRLSSVIYLLGLGEHLEKKPGQLSGGQCQRVALARAIVSEANLCLMDEPLSNLDAKLRNEMRTEIRSLQQPLGMSVIYVTHDQVEAMSMADKIVLMNDGKIEQIGLPEQMYNQPQTIFVGQFIGSPPMNIISDDSNYNSALPGRTKEVNQAMVGATLEYETTEEKINAIKNLRIATNGSVHAMSTDEAWKSAETSVARTYYPQGTARIVLSRLVTTQFFEQTQEIGCRALVLHADEDPIFSIKHGKDIADRIPNATLIVLEGAGHNHPLSLQPIIVSNILEFLNSHS